MASSVDIISALGHALVASQVGPSAGYDAIDIRRAWSVGLAEGVISGGSYKVSQRAAGPNLSVDVAASTGDGALVQGDSVTGQGLYRVAPHTAVINLDIAAANGTNPRVDIVVLESKDDTHDVGGLNIARVRVVTGTASAGATLANRTGAPALPASSLLLADVHVPATDTTIADAQIQDRRPLAGVSAYPGEMRAYGGATAPTGWKLCDGATLNRLTFDALFIAIGTAYGAGDGSTTFLLPNAKGRVLVGLDVAQGEFDVLGDAAGGKTHTLITAEMPAHTHGLGAGNVMAAGGDPALNGPGSFTVTSSVGGGGAHNNLQPYLTINYIIYTGSAA